MPRSDPGACQVSHILPWNDPGTCSTSQVLPWNDSGTTSQILPWHDPGNTCLTSQILPQIDPGLFHVTNPPPERSWYLFKVAKPAPERSWTCSTSQILPLKILVPVSLHNTCSRCCWTGRSWSALGTLLHAVTVAAEGTERFCIGH